MRQTRTHNSTDDKFTIQTIKKNIKCDQCEQFLFQNGFKIKAESRLSQLNFINFISRRKEEANMRGRMIKASMPKQNESINANSKKEWRKEKLID